MKLMLALAVSALVLAPGYSMACEDQKDSVKTTEAAKPKMKKATLRTEAPKAQKVTKNAKN